MRLCKKITLFGLIFIILLQSVSVSATSNSYMRVDTADGETTNVLSQDVYAPEIRIDADTFGLSESFDGITDIYSCEDNSILLLCGKQSGLYRISSDLNKIKKINIVDANGEQVNFKGSQGITSFDNNMFISDTENSRVIICNKNGEIIDTIVKPESDLIPKDFLFQPFRTLVDEKGYIYILSRGCFYGALLFSPEKEFLGFYGANTVKASALDTLSYLWDRLTSTEEKKAASVKTLPYSFVDFSLDSDGYLVTCTGTTDDEKNGEGQIKKISPNGLDILYKRNVRGGYISSNAYNFLENNLVIREDRTAKYLVQNIVSVDVDKYNNVYALDMTNGTIYLYDTECNLLSAFGGGLKVGNQLGKFISPNVLCLRNDELFVADSKTNSITLFKLTEYGKLLLKAQSLYLAGDYKEAKPIWQKVLSKDRNCQLAYRGLAIAYYNEGNYKAAKEMSEISLDYSVYDLAWKVILSDYIAEHFIIILIFIIILVILIAYLIFSIKKKKIVIKLKPQIREFLQVPIHPFKSFEDIKYHKYGSYKIATFSVVLLFVSKALEATKSGFLFTYIDLGKYNIIFTLLSTIGLVMLWTVSNWLVCSMFSGKGNFKEIYVATAYSLTPIIVLTFINTAFSHFIPLSLSGLVNGIQVAILMYTFYLLAIAIMQVHEYDFFKFLATSILTVLFMILLVFFIFMCAILLKQFISFCASVYEEFVYR